MIIGITGGIASGKSSCSKYFSSLGYVVVDADLISREIVAAGGDFLRILVAEFGREVLLSDGNLDRAYFRELIFSDAAVMGKVNYLMHPLIAEIAQERFVNYSQSDIVFYDAALLFEAGHDKFCDFVLTVDIPENLQIERALNRGNITREILQKIMAVQMPRFLRLMRSNFCIDNSGSYENMEYQCDLFLKKIKNL
ncbi:MAG: dephospho-CoA kinase [Cardiobacteriaceae bacterium]|nr:dephospho-CoA kinase [Cardiobacteriaceae bacterium]